MAPTLPGNALPPEIAEALSKLDTYEQDLLAEQTRIASLIQAREDELYAQLAEIEERLARVQGMREAAVGPRKTPAARKKPTTSVNGSPRRGRPKGSGGRRDDALRLVRERPGITVKEVADALGLKANYFYRVLPELEADGLVRKDGRGYIPVEQ